MDLTADTRKVIDGQSYKKLLEGWRFTNSYDPDGKWFQDETGDYWKKRMAELKDTVDHVAISKEVGWDE